MNAKGKYNETPLHWAAAGGKTDGVKVLIKAGADVNTTDDEGYNPLHVTAYEGHTEIGKALIEAGADVDAKANRGSTPLHLAAHEGKRETVKALLKAGAEIDVTDEWAQTPLYIATVKGHTEIVQALRKAGAEVEVTDYRGDTPLNTAQRNGQSEVAAILARKNHPTEIQFQFHLDEINSMWHTGYFNVIEPWGRMESITGDDDMTDHICQYLTTYKGGCSWLWCDSYLDAKIILEYFKKDLLVTGFILRDTARIGPDFSSGTWGHVVWLNVDISKTLKTPTKGKRRSLDEAISSRKSGVPL